MKANKLHLLARCICLTAAAAAGAETVTYVVQQGDTLSGIAQKNVDGPIYGKHGGLEKILSFNPKIRNPDRIYVGDVIHLDALSLRSVAQDASSTPPQAPVIPPPAFVSNMPSRDTHPFGQFSAKLGMDFFRINATDVSTGATATILSNMNPTLAIGWKEEWNDSWSTNFRLNYESVNLQNPTPRTMTNASTSAYGLGLGVEKSFGDTFGILLDVGYDQQFFLESASSQTLTLDTVAVPDAALTLRYDFFRKNFTDLGLKVSGGYLGTGSNSSYTVNSGNFYSGVVYWHQEIPSMKAMLSGEVFYKQTSQNTSIVNQNQTDVGGTIGLTWVFGN